VITNLENIVLQCMNVCIVLVTALYVLYVSVWLLFPDFEDIVSLTSGMSVLTLQISGMTNF